VNINDAFKKAQKGGLYSWPDEAADRERQALSDAYEELRESYREKAHFAPRRKKQRKGSQ